MLSKGDEKKQQCRRLKELVVLKRGRAVDNPENGLPLGCQRIKKLE